MTDPVRKSRVTSFDVAEKAGVNQSTVSRALKGDPAITEKTRTRIQLVAQQLGYRVDDRAARLRGGKTGTIAVIVITRPGVDFTEINPFHYNLLGSVCAAAAARGYQALVSFQSEPKSYYSDYIESRQADSLIILGTSTNDAAWQFHRPLLDRTNVASWGSPFGDHRRIASDNLTGGRLAAERLLQGGYRELVFIGDVDDRQTQFRDRYTGFCDALAKVGRSAGPSIDATGGTRVEQGRNSVEELIASGRAFDGLFCCCDAMALGALQALTKAGISVPKQVGVIGFDGLTSGAHASPPLTTIEPDFKLAGTMLVDAALAGDGEGADGRIPVHIVERASVS